MHRRAIITVRRFYIKLSKPYTTTTSSRKRIHFLDIIIGAEATVSDLIDLVAVQVRERSFKLTRKYQASASSIFFVLGTVSTFIIQKTTVVCPLRRSLHIPYRMSTIYWILCEPASPGLPTIQWGGIMVL